MNLDNIHASILSFFSSMVLVVLGCSCGVCVGGGRVEITVAELIMLVITVAGRMLSFFLASTTY